MHQIWGHAAAKTGSADLLHERRIKKPRTHFSLTRAWKILFVGSLPPAVGPGKRVGVAGWSGPRPKRFPQSSHSVGQTILLARRTAGSESALLPRNVNIRSAAASNQPVQWIAFWQIRMAVGPRSSCLPGRDACAAASERANIGGLELDSPPSERNESGARK